MKFKSIVFICYILSIFIQCIIVLVSDASQVDDSENYLRLAYRITNSGEWYPSLIDNYPDYKLDYSFFIHSPGYVNYLAFLLIIVKHVKGILLINVAINAILGYELFYIGKKYFNEKTGYIVLLLFSIYPTNYGIVCLTGNELIYTMLAFTLIILFTKNKIIYIILTGILIGFANWMRPFLFILFIVLCFLTFYSNDNLINKIKKLTILASSMVLTVFIIGFTTYERFGSFVFQSTTGGYNLIIGANDHADGSFSKEVFKKGNLGYIGSNTSLDVTELDHIWKERAIFWIKKHPTQWILLFPKKFFYLYCSDSHAMSALSGNIKAPVQSRDYTLKMIHTFPKYNKFQWLLFYNQLFYVTCLLLSLFGSYLIIKEKNKIAQALLLYWILGTVMNLLLFGGSKFHYPYMPIILLFASFVISKRYDKNKFKLKNIKL